MSAVSNQKTAKEIHDAKVTLADEMKRLYPDGVINKSGNSVIWDEKTFSNLVRHGKMGDADGKLQPVSDEVRKAAQTILDNGGPASINPSGDPWVTEGDLRRSIENDDRSPIQQFEDFINRQRRDEV